MPIFRRESAASIGRLPMTSPLTGAVARSFASKARPVAEKASIDMRGDAVLYIRKRRGADDDGFHTTHFAGIPYGFVYLDIAETLDKDSGRCPTKRYFTASHERGSRN